jgi:hypothetical protein
MNQKRKIEILKKIASGNYSRSQVRVMLKQLVSPFPLKMNKKRVKNKGTIPGIE